MSVAIAPISQQIWDMKYRLKAADGEALDGTVEDSWRRVASSLAAVENIAVWSAGDFVASTFAVGVVLAWSSCDRVVSTATEKVVIAVAAVDDVVGGSALQNVVLVTSGEQRWLVDRRIDHDFVKAASRVGDDPCDLIFGK